MIPIGTRVKRYHHSWGVEGSYGIVVGHAKGYNEVKWSESGGGRAKHYRDHSLATIDGAGNVNIPELPKTNTGHTEDVVREGSFMVRGWNLDTDSAINSVNYQFDAFDSTLMETSYTW